MDAMVTRRRFLGLGLIPLMTPRLARADGRAGGRRRYEVEIGILYNVLSFGIKGTVDEEVDLAAGRYRVALIGEGAGVSTRTDGVGVIRDGRFKPTELTSVHTVRGRDNKTALSYDYDRGIVQYHSVSYTLFLGRRRQADDVLQLAPGQHVDDIFSAELNFAARKLDVDPDGAHRITVVRRARPVNEGPDDASAGVYRAEFTTVRFRPVIDAATGRTTADLDLTGFSSWARSNRPAHLTFGADRHLTSVESSMILGSSFTLRFSAVA